jgi:hypothetical protein
MSSTCAIARLLFVNVTVVLGYVVYGMYLKGTHPIWLTLWVFLPWLSLIAVVWPTARGIVLTQWSTLHDYSIVLACFSMGYWLCFWHALATQNSTIVLAILGLEIVLTPVLLSVYCDSYQLRRRLQFVAVAAALIAGILLIKFNGTTSDVASWAWWKNQFAEIWSGPFSLVVGAVFFRALSDMTRQRLVERYSITNYDAMSEEMKALLIELERKCERFSVAESKRNQFFKEQLLNALTIGTYVWCTITTALLLPFLAPPGGTFDVVATDFSVLYISVVAVGVQTLLLQRLLSEPSLAHLVTPWGATRHIIYCLCAIATVAWLPSVCSEKFCPTNLISPQSLDQVSLSLVAGSCIILAALAWKTYRDQRDAQLARSPFTIH